MVFLDKYKMNWKYITLLVFTLLLAFVLPKATLAHGTAVSSSKVVGDYKVEFEYDDPQIIAGETNSYVFRLIDNKTNNFVSFDSLLVRFEDKKDQSTVIVARVVQDELQEGVGRFTAMMNKGDYAISLSFYKAGNKVAETNFDLTVIPSDEDRKIPILPIIFGIGGLVLGFIASKLVPHPSLNEKN